MNKRCLVVAAHPDDEILGCGGTMAKMADDGYEVFVAILGEGATSRSEKRDEADKNAVDELKVKARSAAQLMNVKEIVFLDYPDNRFDSVPLLDIVKGVEKIVDSVQPTVVYTHHGGDLNIDHAITFKAVMTATRPMPGSGVKQVFTFEIPSSTEWAFDRLGERFRPNTFVDISDTFGRKLEALKIYDSEMRDYPHPRSSEAVRAIAMKAGSTVGTKMAEQFELIRNLEWV